MARYRVALAALMLAGCASQEQPMTAAVVVPPPAPVVVTAAPPAPKVVYIEKPAPPPKIVYVDRPVPAPPAAKPEPEVVTLPPPDVVRAEKKAPAAKPVLAKPVPAKPVLVSVNTGTAQELETLPRIGKKRAAAIIANRPYRSLDDLVARKALPKSTADFIRPLVRL